MIKHFIKNYEITAIIILINVILFILETLAGSTTNIVAINFGVFVTQAFTLQPRRAITAVFLHFGIVHLLMNMYALYSIGPMVEKQFGKRKYLLIYLFSGICGNLMIFAVESFTGKYSLSAGASGAIFGLIGTFLALYMSLPKEIRDRMDRRNIINSLIFCLLPGLLPGISMSAHVGGLLGGFIISYIFIRIKKPTISIEY